MADEPKEIALKGALTGRLARRFAEEAEKRGTTPAALLADVVAKVVEDDLFAAVLDP